MAVKKPQSRQTARAKAPAELRLVGKVAVVTGASRGIGQAIARALSAEGCTVVITGRDKSTLAKSATRICRKIRGPGKVLPMVCDVRDPGSVALLFGKVK